MTTRCSVVGSYLKGYTEGNNYITLTKPKNSEKIIAFFMFQMLFSSEPAAKSAAYNILKLNIKNFNEVNE